MKKAPPVRSTEYLDKIIRERFSGTLMSDRKWVKLLGRLVDHAHLVKKCRVKLVWEEDSGRELFIHPHQSYQFDYYASAMEGMVSGPPGGWYAYREIEWIAFPRHTGTGSGDPVQDLQAIHRLLEPVAELSVEMGEEALKIYGYK